MSDPAFILIAASALTWYPAFGDGARRAPKADPDHARVEVLSDKGLIVEMVVSCPKGVAMVSFSKVERLFCGPDHTCARDLGDVVRKSCAR